MKYDHKEVEKGLYSFWLKNKLFEPGTKKNGQKNFSLLLPPPNVTGHLHLGHAWGTAIMDCIIRYKKMQGYRTIFIPGTDHAGISTQTKFERILKEQGRDRKDISDRDFLIELNEWAQSQAEHIRKQWSSLGLSLSYKHETFTLDKNVNDLIFSEFKKLYDSKLIYRANKLTNWDVKLQTAISDLENIKKETKGKMWYFKYFLKDSNKKTWVTVATTRPETMFADTNIICNPKDKRYTKYIGKSFINPVNGQELEMISDENIEIDFGTGVMKCTPAHAFEDYEIATKHKITNFKSCIELDGKLNSLANTNIFKLNGTDRIVARDTIISTLQSLGFIEKTEEVVHNVGYSERSGEVIEPLLSLQWFVKMEPVVKNLKTLLKKNKPTYFPPRFEKVMNEWLNKTQDWCISRQLLWGHRIPVWYHKTTNKIYVGTKTPTNIKDYVQDESVLDTWFSSGLWPLATTKYGKTKDIKDFYPIDCLVTGWDIIFFWVARMLFQCSFIDKSISLKNIILTGLIRDKNNKKMSKSSNNGVDPDDMINLYGADSLRATLISGSPNGEDLIFNEDKIVYNRNFLNKIWNVDNLVIKTNSYNLKNLNFINAWMINQLHSMIKEYKKDMDKYNFALLWKKLVSFAWETFANTYLEIAKTNKDKQTNEVINYVYKNILIMLHPFMPFVTEYIYKAKFNNKKSIMLEQLSSITNPNSKNDEAELLIDIYSLIKNIRIKNSIKNTTVIHVNVVSNKKYDIKKINASLNFLSIMIDKITKERDNSNANIFVSKNYAIEITSEISNKADELEKNKKMLAFLTEEIERSNKILNNPSFTKNAPKEKVEAEKKKAADWKKQYDIIMKTIKNIL